MDQQNTYGNLDKVFASYRAVETNCQFLTLVRKHINEENISHQSIQDYTSNTCKMHYENFANLLVQATYMFYSCKYYRLTPQIDVRIQENLNLKKFTVVVYYKIVQTNSSCSFYIRLMELFELLVSFYERCVSTQQFVQKFYIVESINLFIRYVKILQPFLVNLDQGKRQRKFFMLLQETELFREYSLLLKIKNNSMVDYISQNMAWFREYKKIDVQSISAYNSVKKKAKFDPNELKNGETIIQNNINKFFMDLASRMKAKIEGQKQVENDNVFKIRKKICFSFSQATLAERLYKIDPLFANAQIEEPNTSRPNQFEYQIEYSSERNSICVKLILPHVILCLESIDYILVQSNVFTFDNANISFQVMDYKANDETNPTKKVIAFRGASCFNNKEPPLEVILLLMDITMIAAKIYEPELTPTRNSLLTNDSERLAMISQKMEHYTKILLKVTKKVYND